MAATTVAAPALSFVVFPVANLDASHDFFAKTLGHTPNPRVASPTFRQFTADMQGYRLPLPDEHTPSPSEIDRYPGTPDIAALRDTWVTHDVATTKPTCHSARYSRRRHLTAAS